MEELVDKGGGFGEALVVELWLAAPQNAVGECSGFHSWFFLIN